MSRRKRKVHLIEEGNDYDGDIEQPGPSVTTTLSTHFTASVSTQGLLRGQTQHAARHVVSATQGNSVLEHESIDDAQDWQDEAPANHDHDIPPPPKCARRRKRKRQDPLASLIPFRDTFLDEDCRHEGIGGFDQLPNCRHCEKAPGSLKCKECCGVAFLCDGCMVAAHKANPLHTIAKWMNGYWARYTLREAGLRIQLGHDGLSCPRPRHKKTPITIIDLNGIQDVHVDYCDCRAGREHVQLLRNAWWPATPHRPRTAITFRLLKSFHVLNLIGKVNIYDYYRSLEQLVDPTGTRGVKYRYKELSRAVRCYRHIHMTKRAGRAQDPEGIDGTKPGECVVECPLCPHPGRNMPASIYDVPEKDRWKFPVILAVDGNFKLKQKNRGLKDASLSPTFAYIVDKEEYAAHVAKYVDEPELKHCDSNHSAIDHANTPAEKRFSVNGVGAVVCARHAFYQKQGVGDLHRGEAFAPMDFMVMSVLGIWGRDVEQVRISYDIACTYSKNFSTRMARYPSELRINIEHLDIKWAIPKFHLHAHGPDCQCNYSFNYALNVGRSHGESVETGWADLNLITLSTREMAPNARHEVLNDVMGAINFRKVTRIGASLKKNLREAMAYRDKNDTTFQELTKMFPSTAVAQWTAAVEAWEKDDTKPNPYEEKFVATTLNDVRLMLSTEEEAEAAQGVYPLHETTATTFLAIGLDLEEQQRTLDMFAKSAKTTTEKTKLRDRRNALSHRIRTWRSIQHVYMPFAARLIGSTPNADDSPALHPETTPLHLPSSLPRNLRGACTANLLDKEKRLRVGQAHDALHDLRRVLRMKMGLVHYKHIHVDGEGQKKNTQARRVIGGLEDKQNQYVTRYRAAHAALERLEPGGTWAVTLKPLKKEDIVSPRANDPDDPNRSRAQAQRDKAGKRSEGRHTMSWIWIVTRADVPAGVPEAEGEIHESMRIDWLKQRARYMRWSEEVGLTLSEMIAGIKFLEWRFKWWLQRIGLRPNANADIISGVNAYARRQAAIARELAVAFVNLWRPELTSHGIADPWSANDYPIVPQKTRKKKSKAVTISVSEDIELPTESESSESTGTESSDTDSDTEKDSHISDADGMVNTRQHRRHHRLAGRIAQQDHDSSDGDSV